MQAMTFFEHTIYRNYFDGKTDDLLSAGLGSEGLCLSPQDERLRFADPQAPSPRELRRNAIYNNYRAMVDMSEAGGFGSLYGPHVQPNNHAKVPELIAGYEYACLLGSEKVSVVVQIPKHFNRENPCIVAAPASGSRCVYGAIASVGEWALKRGCIVVYTDKGAGSYSYNVQTGMADRWDGTRDLIENLGHDAVFMPLKDRLLQTRYSDSYPHRYALRHAHSQINPEKYWGQWTLKSIEFALFILNQHVASQNDLQDEPLQETTLFNPLEHLDTVYDKSNTWVIASSVSNGGAASLRAAEQDNKALIDAVVIAEPNVSPKPCMDFMIQQGERTIKDHSRNLFDYMTLLNLYQPCANASLDHQHAPFNMAPSAQRCQALRELGLLSADSLEGQASEAQQLINQYGWQPEQNWLQPLHWSYYIPQSISVTYANAYAKASVLDNLGGYSFAAIDERNQPGVLHEQLDKSLYANSNGVAPCGGLQLISNLAENGPIEDRLAVSSISGLADQNVEGALYLRSLALGHNVTNGETLTGIHKHYAETIQESIEDVRASGNLKGKPTIIVTGRDDAVLAINHSSRPYYALNQGVDESSELRYYEVKHAHHLDAFNSLPGLAEHCEPLHPYFVNALSMMLQYLKDKAAGKPVDLPPSQVIDPRRGNEGSESRDKQSLESYAVPEQPKEDKQIRFDGKVLYIPE